LIAAMAVSLEQIEAYGRDGVVRLQKVFDLAWIEK
jgi:hypothetical protein